MNSFAYLVVCMFLDASPCEPDPREADIHAFPSIAECREYLEFATAQLEHLRAISAINPRARFAAEGAIERIENSVYLWRVLRDARKSLEGDYAEECNGDYRECWDVLGGLHTLHSWLSADDYHAGRIPRPVFYLVEP